MDLRGMNIHPLKTHATQKFCSIPIFHNTKPAALRNFEVGTRNDFARVAEGKQADEEAQFLHRPDYCACYVRLQPPKSQALLYPLSSCSTIYISEEMRARNCCGASFSFLPTFM
jgi:hypothetical protein